MYRKSQYILLSQEHLYHDTLPFSISYTTSATFIVEVLCDTSTTVRLALSSFRDFRMMPSFRESRLEVGSSRRRLPARSFHYGVLMPDKVFKNAGWNPGISVFFFGFYPAGFWVHIPENSFFPPVLYRTVQNSCPLFLHEGGSVLYNS